MEASRNRIAALTLTTVLVVGPAFAEDVAGTLVLYTSQPDRDAQQTVDAFNEVHPDVEVEWLRDGTTQMMARQPAEFEVDPRQPDVQFIADTAPCRASSGKAG